MTTFRYRVYRNLHHGNWTVQHKVPGKGWRKLQGVDALYAPHVTFKVYESGLERTRREGKKYVHAYALCNNYQPLGDEASERIYDLSIYSVTYNPYNDRGFTTSDGSGRNLSGASKCVFSQCGRIGADLTDSSLG